MRRGGLDLPPMGGPGKVVEVDEAYHGNVDERRAVSKQRQWPSVHKRRRSRRRRQARHRVACRARRNVRSFHVPTADAATVAKIVRENVHRESRLHTDESKLYVGVGAEFAAHETVNHAPRNMPAAT